MKIRCPWMQGTKRSLPDVWLQDADAIAGKLGVRHYKVKLAPRMLMGSNPAMVLPTNTIWINPKIVSVSDTARHYVLAHEFGHVRHRHGKKALLTFLLLCALIPLSLAAYDLLAGLYIALRIMPHGLGEHAEYQADAVAFEALGSPLAVIKAQQELLHTVNGRADGPRVRRWIRLTTLSEKAPA
jgi:hypothetical protein